MNRLLSLALLAVCGATVPVRAGWLTISNPPIIPAANGTLYNLTLPGWGGTATVQALTSGGNLWLRPYSFYNSADFSEYPNNGLNPTGSDQYVLSNPMALPALVNVRFDFTGLTNGYLPAGSVFTIRDLDPTGQELLDNLQAFQGSAFTPVTSAWLQLVANFDANGTATATGLNPTGVADYATLSFTGGVGTAGGPLTFTPVLNDTDIPTLYFITTQNLSALSLRGQFGANNRGFSVAIAVPDGVPEPATFALCGGALLAAGLLRRTVRKA